MGVSNLTYFNAGFVNTQIDKNDEDDKYVEMRHRINQMVQNKCYGRGEMNVSFEKSTVHVPFNVYYNKTEVVLGANMTGRLDQAQVYMQFRK